jgi:hypothetical protein
MRHLFKLVPKSEEVEEEMVISQWSPKINASFRIMMENFQTLRRICSRLNDVKSLSTFQWCIEKFLFMYLSLLLSSFRKTNLPNPGCNSPSLGSLASDPMTVSSQLLCATSTADPCTLVWQRQIPPLRLHYPPVATSGTAK